MLYEEFLLKVEEFEGLRTKAYRCSSGVLTIGYGHTHGVTPEMVITGYQADEFLKYDLLLVRLQLSSLHPDIFCCSGLFYALTDFIFNVGITNYKRSTLKKVVDEVRDPNALTESEKHCISLQLMMWCYSKSKKLKGLEKRRSWEVSLLYED